MGMVDDVADEVFDELYGAMKRTWNHDRVNLIYSIFNNGIQNNNERELLGRSLFYYCCGSDPTPIISLNMEYKLYFYVDNAKFADGDTQTQSECLYQKLEKEGFEKTEIRPDEIRYTLPDDVELTIWSHGDDEEKIILLYMYDDAERAFKRIYGDKNNYIQPNCICNYMYEYTGGNNFRAFIERIEKRTEYILGHCFDDKYGLVDRLDYYGSESGKSSTKVELYQRKFWYVW